MLARWREPTEAWLYDMPSSRADRPGTGDDGGGPAGAGDRLAPSFFHQVRLHRELANLAFKRRNVCLVLGNNANLLFLVVQFATIELREPQLDEIS